MSSRSAQQSALLLSAYYSTWARGVATWQKLAGDLELRQRFWFDVASAAPSISNRFEIGGDVGRELKEGVWFPVLQQGADEPTQRDERGRWVNTQIFGRTKVVLSPYDFVAMLAAWRPEESLPIPNVYLRAHTETVAAWGERGLVDEQAVVVCPRMLEFDFEGPQRVVPRTARLA